MLANFSQSLTPAKAEESAAALRNGVLANEVWVILSDQDQPTRFRSGVVYTVAISAVAEIDSIAADHVMRASPQSDSPTGIKGEVIVIDPRFRNAIQA